MCLTRRHQQCPVICISRVSELVADGDVHVAAKKNCLVLTLSMCVAYTLLNSEVPYGKGLQYAFLSVNHWFAVTVLC